MSEEFKLDPAIKARWVEALRSGKYVQGRLRLRSYDNKFCCLGVLVDVIAPEAWVKGKSWGDDYIVFGEALFVPQQVCPIPRSVQDTLTKLNDGMLQGGQSFAQIADWIEEHLLSELKITTERVLKAAKTCGDAKRVLVGA